MRKILAILILASLTACTYEPEIGDLVKNMVVQTNYDVTGPNGVQNVFKTFETYVFKLDTIGYISPFYPNDSILVDNTSSSTTLLKASFVSEVTDAIKDNVDALGFEHVEESENPDFGIKVVILEQFSFFQTVNYPGYYSGYYGYYGGYYGPIVNTYSSNFVTMVVEIVDIKNFAANKFKYKVIWVANIGDVASSVNRDVKIVEAVNQAFVQSPYFSKD